MSITVVFSRHGRHATKYMGPEGPFRSVLSDVAGKLGVGKVAYDLFEHKTKSHIKETDTPMKVWDSDLALSVPGRCTSFRIDDVARLEDGPVRYHPVTCGSRSTLDSKTVRCLPCVGSLARFHGIARQDSRSVARRYPRECTSLVYHATEELGYYL